MANTTKKNQMTGPSYPVDPFAPKRPGRPRKVVLDVVTEVDGEKRYAPIEGRYKCLICGRETPEPAGHFFMVRNSPLWIYNGGYAPFCIECLENMYKEMVAEYHSTEFAIMVLCHYVDAPFYYNLYKTAIQSKSGFPLGKILRQTSNSPAYKHMNFATTLKKVDLEANKSDAAFDQEIKWSATDIKRRDAAIKIIGYDPFESYLNSDRKYLFGELSKYFDADEDIADDAYKISQIIQIVNNNNQIRQCDYRISKLDSVKDSAQIKDLNVIKAQLVSSNDKIAKENEISVKNRSNKEVGKNTFGGLMKRLRGLNFEESEANYYDQLRSPGTQWAVDISTKSIVQNGMFDENDKKEIFEIQRNKIIELTRQLDDQMEENRLLKIQLKTKDAAKNKSKPIEPEDEHDALDNDLENQSDVSAYADDENTQDSLEEDSLGEEVTIYDFDESYQEDGEEDVDA